MHFSSFVKIFRPLVRAQIQVFDKNAEDLRSVKLEIMLKSKNCAQKVKIVQKSKFD